MKRYLVIILAVITMIVSGCSSGTEAINQNISGVEKQKLRIRIHHGEPRLNR